MDIPDEDEELEIFVEAQDSVWSVVCAELAAGRKQSHWIWFVFPQLAELGRSNMAQLYGLEDCNEAARYLAHPVLGPRLTRAAGALLAHSDCSAEAVMGSEIDARKLCSSMTLFAALPDAPPVFAQVLDAFFDGTPCPLTRAALGRD